MTKSTTALTLAFTLVVLLFVACANKKNAEPVQEPTTDTLVQTITTPEVTDTLTDAAPDNTVTKETPARVEQPAVKADISGKGTIVQKGDIWVIRTSGPEGTDYLPSNLTKAFQIDGKSVTFEANLDAIPKGVRMAGRPITLVRIQ